MNYVKSFWSPIPTSSANGEVIQTQPTASNFNPVTFTTATSSGNSIIITTVPATTQQHQHPNHGHQIVYHNSNNLRPDMVTSPTDSFHSASSTCEQHNEKANSGKTNLAYMESPNEINNNNNSGNNNAGRQIHAHQQNNQIVHREQYWSCQHWNFLGWDRWNQREKIFLIIIIVLSLCVLTLVSLLSVVIEKNLQYKEIILSKLGDDGTSIT